MHPPLIGITAKRDQQQSPASIILFEHYTRSILDAGGIPIILPTGIPANQAEAAALRVDGILISGGGDVDHAIYNGRPHARVYNVDPDRDALEMALVSAARQYQIPLLGICRGLQVINVALGGTLFSDIRDQFPTSIEHSTGKFDDIAHTVKINGNTRLSDIVQREKLEVNSLHHQGIDRLGQGLRASAVSSDGLTEGIESLDNRFLIAVQWHPETMHHDQAAQAVFQSLIEASLIYHNEHKYTRR